MKFNLGDRVCAFVRLQRRRVWRGRHEWYKMPWGGCLIEGTFVGVRTYANGTCSGGCEWDGPIKFHPDEWIKVALICRNPRQKPIPVLYAECHLIKALG